MQADKDCARCRRIMAELQSDPCRLGEYACCLLWDEAEPLNEIVTQSRTTTKTILWYLPLIWKLCTCTHDAFPHPHPLRYLAIPESACSALKWGLCRLALALPSLMARMIQGCRSSDMWERDGGCFSHLLARKETHKAPWSCTHASEPTSGFKTVLFFKKTKHFITLPQV